MDRNTLLAFFLIALVLLFTPKYMETFGPQSPESDLKKNSAPEQNLGAEKVVGDSLKIARLQTDTKHIKKQQHPEETTIVETPLYVASFSSINGGTIKEFLHKEFLSPDSQLVNTIHRSKSENLIVEIKDLNGDPLPLDGAWELTKKPEKHSHRSPKTLEYKQEVFQTNTLKNHLSFTPTTIL